MEEFPEALQKVTGNLRNLDLSANKITSIPRWISNFKALKTLNINGNRPKESGDGLLHQGLAARDFIKKFVLSDDMVIKGAALSNGMLYVGIERIIPDEKKPQKIKLTSKSKLLG